MTDWATEFVSTVQDHWPGVSRERALRACMVVLGQLERWVGKEVEPLEEELSAEVAEVGRTEKERVSAATADELFEEVAHALKIHDPRAATEAVASVFAAMRARLSPDEVKHVGAQLPEGIRELWLKNQGGARPG